MNFIKIDWENYWPRVVVDEDTTIAITGFNVKYSFGDMATAEITLPSTTEDQNLSEFINKTIEITIGHANPTSLFQGYITQAKSNAENTTLSAKSPLYFFQKIYNISVQFALSEGNLTLDSAIQQVIANTASLEDITIGYTISSTASTLLLPAEQLNFENQDNATILKKLAEMGSLIFLEHYDLQGHYNLIFTTWGELCDPNSPILTTCDFGLPGYYYNREKSFNIEGVSNIVAAFNSSGNTSKDSYLIVPTDFEQSKLNLLPSNVTTILSSDFPTLIDIGGKYQVGLVIYEYLPESTELATLAKGIYNAQILNYTDVTYKFSGNQTILTPGCRYKNGDDNGIITEAEFDFSDQKFSATYKGSPQVGGGG